MKHWSKLLLVDDEPRAHTLMENMLVSEDYVLLHARNGRQALAFAAEIPPDVILLDVMMPEMDGFETCRRLRANPKTQLIPIIMLTALDDRESRLEGFEAGADDYISKPFDALELRSRLRTITRLNRFRRLYEERNRFEAVVDAAPEGIVVTDPDGKIVVANPAFEKLVPAYGEAENFFECLDADQSNEWRSRLDACHPGDVLPTLAEAKVASGRPGLIVEVTGCLHTTDGSPRFHFYVRDVTDRKLMEAKLLQGQRVELVGQLAGGIVHDVNNMLTAVVGFTEMIDTEGSERNERFKMRVLSSSGRAQALLRSILAFARGTSARVETLDLAGTLREGGDLIRGMIGKRYTLHVDTADALPPFEADPTELHQILMNLCVNAKDAMPNGGPIEVTAATREVSEEEAAGHAGAKAGPHVVLTVRDTGCGIAEEHLPRLFEPFYTTKPEGQGTGLGLATVLRLVTRYSGFVTVASQVERGTTVSCHLPVGAALTSPSRETA